VSIEVLKQELAALDVDQQRLMTAFLVSLQDLRDAAYRGKLAAKISQPTSSFATLEELDKRLDSSGSGGHK
jgi:hypothetical protein